MFVPLLSTDPDWVLTVVRAVLGVILFAHGAQKLLGWYGGPGYARTIRALQEQAHLPYLVAVFVILVEFVGGLCLIVGLFGRLAALGIAAMMAGAIATVHYRNGLFLNWFGEKKGHGFEYHLLAIALALIVVVKGSGAFSVDHTWCKHVRNSQFMSELTLFGRCNMTIRPFEAGRATLGFIGLGNMGSRIVERLLGAGYQTQVYDARPEKAAPLEKQGAKKAAGLEQLACGSDVVLSCLTDDGAVTDVYAGSAGVIRSARPGTLVLEMSTISPDTSRKIANLATEVGVHVLDVAISGSTPAAERGDLILFAGGNPDLFEAARPVLQAFSKKAFHLGPSGAGTTMKLVVNAILGIEMQAIAEASALGQKAGLDRKVLLDVLSQTAVIAPAHAGKLGRAAADEFSPQFPLRLMAKDFRLILDEANARNASMPATEASYRISAAALVDGQEEDFSVVMKYMETAGHDTRRANAFATHPGVTHNDF